MRGAVSVSVGLGSINNLAHLFLFLFREFNISRSPVVLKTSSLGRSRNGDHALGSNPSESNLANVTALLSSELLDFLDDCSVLVEVVALEFRSYQR